MLTYLRSVWQDEEGVTTVEYALILALVSVVAIAAWQGLGIEVREQATNTTTAMQNVPAT